MGAKKLSKTDEAILQSLSELIGYECHKYYKSYRKLAEACDVDPRTIRNIINMETKPSILVISKIAVALSYDSLSEFLKEAGL